MKKRKKKIIIEKEKDKKVNKVLEDMCIYGNIAKKEIKEEKNINKKNFEKQKTIIEYLSNKNDIKEQYEQLKEMAKNAIIKAQNFVRKKYGDSSVSLREIRRFSIFYEFFVHYLPLKEH